VEIIEQGDATRQAAKEYVELAVCGEPVLVLEACGGEEGDREGDWEQRRNSAAFVWVPYNSFFDFAGA
jgi:hypothetical protein